MSATTFPLRHRRTRIVARAWLRDRLRGDAADPSWARPALIALLALTAAAYLWNLTASGYANSFYAAAAEAATKSWKAFFFGSIDSSNFITVDKPPASLWVMGVSGRLFGFGSASMLVPQVLEGVLAVGLLSVSVKRWFGAGAGLLAGATLAATPVAALMFRFNNPDALLVCLLVASAYCLVRALDSGSTRWMIWVGTLIGFAFLAKMMQAFLVVPGFALVYLLAAPRPLRRRTVQLLAGAAAIIVSAGWWVAIVALWPAGSRPMIDGSSSNNIFDLIIGYNGLGRIFGSSGPGGGGGPNFSGQTGVLRLFNDAMGAQAAWLLPASLLALVAVLWWTRRAPRTDRLRAAALLWGGWLFVSGAVFSLGSGVIHTYYTVALAPAIAALVAIGAAVAWRRRTQTGARAVMALGVGGSSLWAIVLLDRTAAWNPWLRPAIGFTGAMACLLLLAPDRLRLGRRGTRVALVLSLVACLGAPVAYAAQTIGTAHTGSVPSAGPASAQDDRGGAGMAPGAGMPPVAGMPGSAGMRPPEVSAAGGPTGFAGPPVGAGGPGGYLNPGARLVAALKTGASGYRWVAATSGSENAASLELASGGEPVMAIGGFNNQGGNITLAQFERYVRAGEIHYYIAGSARGGAPGGMPGAGMPGAGMPGAGPPGASGGSASAAARGDGGPGAGPGGVSLGSSGAITAWVESHFRSLSVGGQTIYDLTQQVRS